MHCNQTGMLITMCALTVGHVVLAADAPSDADASSQLSTVVVTATRVAVTPTVLRSAEPAAAAGAGWTSAAAAAWQTASAHIVISIPV